MEDTLFATGYVVRNEQVLPDTGGGLLRLDRAEGERVSAGGLVGTVYADQASLDRQEELGVLQTRMEQLRYARETAESAEVSLRLDTQIMEELMELRGHLAGGYLDRAEVPGKALHGNISAVMDGDIDEFINAYLTYKSRENK